MNRLQRWVAKNLFGINFGVAGANTWEGAQLWEIGLPTQDPYSLDDAYAKHATVAIAIGAIVYDSASVRWEVRNANTDEELDDHPLLDIFKRPNADMRGNQLWVATYLSYMVFGEAFWFYPDFSFRAPGSMAPSRGEVVLLDPRAVKTKRADDGTLNWYIRVRGKEVPLDTDRLTQFKRFNPYDPVRGLSKIASVMAEICGDYEAAKWNERFFGEQNGMPTGILTPAIGSAVVADRDQRNEILRTWNQRHGARRSVGIIPPGWTFSDLGTSQKDMDFRSLREYSREQILAAFGVPPFLAGVLDKANYANAREQKEVYWLGTITRFLTEIQDTLNHDFLPKVGVSDVLFYPDWEAVKALVENLGEKVEIAAALFGIGFTRRQINDRLELGFDVDDLEDADTQYLLSSYTTVEKALAPPAPMPSFGGGGGGDGPPPADDGTDGDEPDVDGDDPDAEKGLDVRVTTSKVNVRVPVLEEHRRALLWRSVMSWVDPIEDAANKTVRSHINNLFEETLANLNGLKGWNLKQKANPEPINIDAVLFDEEEADKAIRRRVEPHHRQATKRGGEQVIAEVNVPIAFNMQNPAVTGFLAQRSYELKKINKTIRKQIYSILAEGLADSATIEELAKELKDLKGVTLNRARTIARTETGLAFNAGRFFGLQQSGVDQIEWLSSRDRDVRDSHQLDGKRVRVGEEFSNGLRYPQDPSGGASEIINCRCVALPVVED